MTIQSITEMSDQAFQTIIDNTIERAAVGEADVPANVFFDLLAKRMEQNVDETVHLTVEFENNDLTLRPDREFADILIRGNEIIVGKHRFVLQFSGHPTLLPAEVG